MSYSEFSSSSISNACYNKIDYTNAMGNWCSQSYTNCTNTHSNYGNWGCANTTSCSQSCNDYRNDCQQHQNYSNAWSTSATYGGGDCSGSLSWPTWDVAQTARFQDSIAELESIRDNINIIKVNKHRGIVYNGSSTDNYSITIYSEPSLDFSNSADSTYNDNNSGTNEKINDAQYNNLLNNLNTLWSSLNGGSSGLSAVTEGGSATAAQVNNLKAKVVELAQTVVSYTNHFNYTNHSHTNYVNYYAV